MAGKFSGFSTVKLQKPLRSAFDLSHQKRTSTRMGRLTPVLITECVPSDTFRGSSEILMRLAPLLAPIYDQINLFVHFFFVPNRLLWNEWEVFITGGRLGVGIDPLVAPIPPYVDLGEVLAGGASTFEESHLSDYLGVPNFNQLDPDPADWNGIHLDMMPFAAYQLCWYEYYRDRNFIADDFFPIPLPLFSGEVDSSMVPHLFQVRTRNYLHDYYTSALPFTQRGEEVLMPVQLGGNAPLYFEPLGVETTNNLESTGVEAYGIISDGAPDPPLPAGSSLYVRGQDFDGTSTSINDFRSAYALQVWLERNAIGGSRYTESTQAHFGVKPQDSRLQRPEYIGGGMIPVRISEVVSTAYATDAVDDSIPQGNLAGHGITYGNTNNFSYFCTEHGFIIGIASIMNPPTYQEGLPRMFRRRSFLDYPWPTFAKLGEQEVSNYELYANPVNMTEDADGDLPLFGYQSRYADWKYICNQNSGQFKSTLLFWSLTRVFGATPELSAEFNEFDDEVQNRIFAVPGAGPGIDNFWLYINNRVTVKRPLPYFGTPNTLGFS